LLTTALVAAVSVAGMKVCVLPTPSNADIVNVFRVVGKAKTVVRHGSTSVTENVS
jgi:hypothetical protein